MENERGEGRMANFISLIVLAGALYASWNLIPVYFANYSFKDHMVDAARLPKSTNKDEKVMDTLMKGAQEEGLYGIVNRQDCRVQTFDTSRRITCEYEREVQVLPGWKRVIHFENDVNMPLLW